MPDLNKRGTVTSVFRIVPFLFILWTAIAFLGCRENVQVLPTTPEIRYVGRFDFRDSLHPRFDWPGSYIEAVFEGTSVGVYLKGGLNAFNVILDGRLLNVINLDREADTLWVVWLETIGDSLATWTRFPMDSTLVDSLLTQSGFRPDTLSLDSLLSWRRKGLPDSLMVADSLDNRVLVPPDTFFQIATGLPDTLHTLRITKRTEAVFGVTTFGGLVLDNGKGLAPPPPERNRKMLFLGDSFVAGYGNEGASPECGFSRDTENSYHAYGSMLARRFRADYMLIAKSGAGIVRNFGETTAASPDPFPYYEQRRLMNVPGLPWNPNEWIPDVVVVRLGNNDFYARPYPQRWAFRQAYASFLDKLRNNYPSAEILALCGPTSRGFYCPNIERVVEERRVLDQAVHYVRLDVPLNRGSDFGCDWHPNVAGHRKIADALEPYISWIMNWQ